MSAPSQAELIVVEEDTDGGHLTTFKMTISPAAEPVPALKHRLVAREIDMKQGNAVPYYYRALMGVSRDDKVLRKKYGDAYDEWRRPADVPLSDLPLDKVRQAANAWQGSVMENLREATLRRECNWEWDVQAMRGPDLIAFLLEEIQESRIVSRVLSLRTRLAMAERDYQRAIDELRMNYRLGRDVAKEPLLICDLVGIAICSTGNHSLIELIAQPNSPNLYWAIAELPKPMVSVRESMRTEMSLGLRTFPFILDAETAEHSPEEWARLLANAVIEQQQLTTGGLRDDEQGRLMARFGMTAMSAVAYPAAKQRLIDSGMDPQRVEGMPVGKVVSVDALRVYRRIADDIEKWSYVPYRESRKHSMSDAFKSSSTVASYNGFGYVLANSLLPAVQAARQAEQRLLWNTLGIQTVEAIRMHAAETGKLPEKLSEIEIVPVPRNPVTDEFYEYELRGETATVDLPFSDGFAGIAWRFEITLAP
ncbi:hypothetical protein [Adhaeretor mobilis]|nr:hypothetical protein [Adhaeretor mobilis]